MGRILKSLSKRCKRAPTFVDSKASAEFICPLCGNIFTNPVQVPCGAGHIFCNKCVMESVTVYGSRFPCPRCNRLCHSNSITRVQFIDRQIQNLMVKCLNHQITSEKAKYIRNKRQSQQQQNESADNSNSNGLRRSKRLKEKQKQQQNEEKEQEDIDLNKQRICGQKRKISDDEYTINDNNNNSNKRAKLNDEELCDWIGNYGHLCHHIIHCPLQLIKCEYCDLNIMRREIDEHINKCPDAPIRCKQCGRKDITRVYMDVHIKDFCPKTVINCYQCRALMQRSDFMNHLNNDCAETMIKCTFHGFGCCEKFKRKDTCIHNVNRVHSHLVQVTNKFNQYIHKVNALENENQRLKARVARLERR